MAEPSLKEEVDAGISVDVFSVSAAMVGVCLTVIQLIKMNGTQAAHTIADELLAFNAILFLTTCLVAFLALKNKRHSQLKKRLENVSDACFLLAISIMVVATAFVTFSIF